MKSGCILKKETTAPRADSGQAQKVNSRAVTGVKNAKNRSPDSINQSACETDTEDKKQNSQG